jgi:hypothetical protein
MVQGSSALVHEKNIKNRSACYYKKTEEMTTAHLPVAAMENTMLHLSSSSNWFIFWSLVLYWAK